MSYHVLGEAVHAWNVDGSSGDTLPHGSWIGHWESVTGQRRGECSYEGCTRVSDVGGHVWIKRQGVHLVPICTACNYWENATKMQDDSGNHPRLKRGVSVIPMQMTTAMRQAQRRLATSRRVCGTCDEDISSRPLTHTLCYGCFRGSTDVRGCAKTTRPAKKRRTRTCEACGRGIGSAPAHHRYCRSCFG